jgi:outer membrane protein OmpA-like peptidoglycan-associated protein
MKNSPRLRISALIKRLVHGQVWGGIALISAGCLAGCQLIHPDSDIYLVGSEDKSPPAFELIEEPLPQPEDPPGSLIPPGKKVVAQASVAERTSQELSPGKPVPVRIFKPVRFQPDMTTLDKTARKQLTQDAKWIIQNPSVWYMIEGHTGTLAGPAYAYHLGQARAGNVRQFLQNQGIRSGILFDISYGRDRPVLDAGTPEAGQLNNRVEMYGFFLPNGVDIPARKFKPSDPAPEAAMFEPDNPGIELYE